MPQGTEWVQPILWFLLAGAVIFLALWVFLEWRRECLRYVWLSFAKGEDYTKYYKKLPPLEDMIYKPKYWTLWTRRDWIYYAERQE